MSERQLFVFPGQLEEEWHRVAQAGGALGARGRARSRIADLAVARVAAESLDLVPKIFTGSTRSVLRLQRALTDLAAFDLPSLSADRVAWEELRETAAVVGARVAETRALDEWSAASQASDSGRKGKGAYGTPSALATELVRKTLEPFATASDAPRICDPSAGHGALLIAALDFLVEAGHEPAEVLASLNGVELDPHAWELCCLMVWLAVAVPGVAAVPLVDVRRGIVLGNALRGCFKHGQEAGSQRPLFNHASDSGSELIWDVCFDRAFARDGFDAIVMNPPWESLRHKLSGNGDSWAEREETHRRLSEVAGSGRHGLPPLYSRQGRGDRNLYKGFVELAPHLVRDGGRVGALLPGAFASDLGMQPARELYLEHMAIEQWTSFENLENYFPIDSRYKFGILVARRSTKGTARMRVRFLSRRAAEVSAPHVDVTRAELVQLGGSSSMFPEVSSKRELSVLKRAFESGTPFFDTVGSFGPIRYQRELDLTLDRRSERFRHVEHCRRDGYAPRGDGSWETKGHSLVPLIEGRMVGAFDFFQKSWHGGEGRSALWTHNGESPLASCQPQFLAERIEGGRSRLAICDVTSATNTRTMLAAWIPRWPCGNTAPVLVLDDVEASLALLAVLNSMTFDWMLRRIVAGLHLNRFYLDATPLPRIASGEVARLARFAAGVTNASPRVASLDSADREGLPAVSLDRCGITAAEVEAAVARGYGLTPEHFEYVLSRDETERKGLWRYYASSPEAAQVAEESLRLLEAA